MKTPYRLAIAAAAVVLSAALTYWFMSRLNEHAADEVPRPESGGRQAAMVFDSPEILHKGSEAAALTPRVNSGITARAA